MLYNLLSCIFYSYINTHSLLLSTIGKFFRVSRAERDSSQKRTLLEDQRNRVKTALESAKADAESLVSNGNKWSF